LDAGSAGGGKEMKWCLAAISIVMTTAVMAGGGILSDGNFTGTGQWIGPQGSSGEYRVETRIEGHQITSAYDYQGQEGQQQRSYILEIDLQDQSWFQVRDNSGVVGEGFCYESDCFYHVEAHGMNIQEHLRLEGGRLHKFGSKTGPGFRVVWKETLDAQ
jgi:hypothetical protein